MLGTGRQRGIRGRLLQCGDFRTERLNFRTEFCVLGEQKADDGLSFRRLAGDQFLGDYQRHARQCAEMLSS